MGQQQLLLIVLGVIIVGIAVVVGIQMFSTSAAQANFDAVMGDLQKMGSDAQGWFRKPVSMGGGGRSFVALADSSDFQLIGGSSTTENGAYTISTPGTDTEVTFEGVGVEDLDGNDINVTIQLTVTQDAITANVVDR